MTEFKKGDRVRVEFEGGITHIGDTDGIAIDNIGWIPPEYITKIATPLPTKMGAVIESRGYRFMLTAGGWRADSDHKVVWSHAELQDSYYAEDFTVLLDGKD